MKTISIRPFFAAKLLIFGAAVVVLFSGCDLMGIRGNGNVVTQKREVTDFSALEASGAIRVEWTPGPASLAIVTDENLLGFVDSEVSGRKLILRTHNNLRPTRHLTARVSSPSLTSVALHGAVRLTAANLNARDFYLDATGATHIELGGTTASVNATLSGASHLDAESLHAQNVDMSISGAGHADVYATDNLKVTISGAGKVIYDGNPKVVERKISGAGRIKPRG